jgi:hypothetical protein
MQQLLAGSSVNEQIQENLNKSDFCFGALSQQFLQSEYITTQEIPHFLQQKSLFLFGLDKRIDGKASSIDDFFSKVSRIFINRLMGIFSDIGFKIFIVILSVCQRLNIC